jgi:hypothetical protein
MKQAGPARASSVVVRLRLLAAAGMGACIVVAGWAMPEVRLVRGAAAAVPLAQTHAGAGTVLPSPPQPARRLAEETQPQSSAELPLKEESHPPPIVNYVPPKPKHKVDDKSRKTNTKTSTKTKSDTKSAAKKAAPSKTKSVRAKRKTK